jgi:hypothetical protein
MMVLDQQHHVVRSTDPALRAIRREEGSEETHVIIHGGLVVANQPSTEVLDPVALFDKLKETAIRQTSLITLAIEQIFLEPDKKKQADGVVTLTRHIHGSASWMIEQLGQMLYEAEERHLYMCHDCDTMPEWLEYIGIDKQLAKRAKLVNTNASFLRLIEAPIEDVVKADVVKVTEVDEIRRYYDSQVRGLMSELPKTASNAEKREFYEEKMQQYAPEINAQVNSVLTSKNAAIVKQQIQRSGSTQKAFLPMEVDIDETTQEVTFRAKIPYLTMPGGHLLVDDDELDEDEIENDFGFFENGYRIQFHVGGQDSPVDYRDLPLAIQTLYEQKHNRARVGKPSRKYTPPSAEENDWGV